MKILTFLLIVFLSSCDSNETKTDTVGSNNHQAVLEDNTKVYVQNGTAHLGTDKVVKLFVIKNLNRIQKAETNEPLQLLGMLNELKSTKTNSNETLYAVPYLFLPCSKILKSNSYATLQFSVSEKSGKILIKSQPTAVTINKETLYKSDSGNETCMFIAGNSMPFKLNKQLDAGEYNVSAELKIPSEGVTLPTQVKLELVK